MKFNEHRRTLDNVTSTVNLNLPRLQNISFPPLTTLRTTCNLTLLKKSFPTESQSQRPGKLFQFLKARTIDPDGLNIR